MAQAIVTKYLPPTNTKPGRIRATCAAKSITWEWADNLDTTANHREAIRALLLKLGWGGKWFMGCLPSGGYVAVNHGGFHGSPSVSND